MKGIRTELPTIEKGIPCPFKTHPSKYKKKPSMWHDFLQSLVPGDSFLVLDREIQNLTHIARQVQVMLVVRHGPVPELQIPDAQARVWLAPEPSTPPTIVAKKKPGRPKTPPPAPPVEQDTDLSLI